jgi:hypothetical protein
MRPINLNTSFLQYWNMFFDRLITQRIIAQIYNHSFRNALVPNQGADIADLVPLQPDAFEAGKFRKYGNIADPIVAKT